MGFSPFPQDKQEWVPRTRQDGKTAIVTGSSKGIGLSTAQTLAALGAHVVLVGIDPDWVFEEAIEKIVNVTGCLPSKLEHMHMDLGSQASIRKFADAWARRSDTSIHILVNNAGIPGMPGLSEDGWEMCWGINYIGTTLLTRSLLRFMTPFNRKDGDDSSVEFNSTTAESFEPARIVFVSSSAHLYTLGLSLDEKYLSTPGSGFFSFRYGQSKLAVLIFARELANRLESAFDSPMRKVRLEKEPIKSGPLAGPIHVYTVHPGSTSSAFWSGFPSFVQKLLSRFCQTTDQGAMTSVYCATEPSISDETGLYYADCQVASFSSYAQDRELSKVLWKSTCEWTACSESIV
ncbi:hypothetical protein BB560_006653 [Smittium megazygosporum]|uniref:Ketoreductase (KR) domain-containing protein n=1 Tax=Smittium megazygosporum TaxID=133381 RepID=A0A2T9Y2M8_9FUNG|nr:hypothetical protein BB560_006653 [Smittium megazygosporum]